jgi:hypothetical protein
VKKILSYPEYAHHRYSRTSASVTANVGGGSLNLDDVLSIELDRKVTWAKSWGHRTTAATRTRSKVDFEVKIKLTLEEYNLLIAKLEEEAATTGLGSFEVPFHLTCTLWEESQGTTLWEFVECKIASENAPPIPEGDDKQIEVTLELSVMNVIKDRVAIVSDLSGRGPAAAIGGSGASFWGLNDSGVSPNDAPLFASNPWDTFWINGRRMPGECSLLPGSIARLEVIRKKGKERDGADVTVSGYDPREFSITVQISTPEQWAEYLEVLRDNWPAPGKVRRRVAVLVAHPNLAALQINTAVLAGVSPMVDGKIDGAKYSTWSFQEQLKSGRRGITKRADAPVPEKGPQPAAARLGRPVNAPPPPPESVAANMSTRGH